MKSGELGVSAAIAGAEEILSKNPNLSSEVRAVILLLLTVIKIFSQKLGLHSGNSHLPSSQDPIGFKRAHSLRKLGSRPVGGQQKHVGVTLEKVPEPDEVMEHKVRKCVGCGESLLKEEATSFESRQVFEVVMQAVVIEHRAEVKSCHCCGRNNIAPFPEGVTKAVQYGPGLKAMSCYMSQYQLVPYNRIVDFFRDFCGLPISQGTLVNFNEEAYEKLAGFEEDLKHQLSKSKVNHADETGINVNSDTYWVHVLSNERWTFLMSHIGRNAAAGIEMGILGGYTGYLVHDHNKSYFQFKNCKHVLCNAHHLRELEWAHEFEGQKWAKKMAELLLEINDEVKRSQGPPGKSAQENFTKRYRAILKAGARECPKNTKLSAKSRNGKLKQSKSRNLLNRLRDFESETLMFMRVPGVPFTNNQAERDFRMTKVQQKISGCFRTLKGAQMFCRIRSFLSSAQKHSQSPLASLITLFTKNSWDFAE